MTRFRKLKKTRRPKFYRRPRKGGGLAFSKGKRLP